AQVAWAGEVFGIASTTMAGPELPDDNGDWRLFEDVVLTLKPAPWLAFGAQLDVGYQEFKDRDDAVWHAYAGYARWAPLDWLAFALRAEPFRDPENGISGLRQTLAETTGTIEIAPWKHLSVKLEARYDHSTANAFARRRTAPDGSGPRADDQLLFVAGV